MKIGILGSGDVAQALGAGFLERGDEVKLGTRDTSKLADWLATAGPGASAGSFTAAAEFGEIVVLATNGMVTLEIIEEAVGEAPFHGKIVIDATNPVRMDDGKLHLAIGFDDSLGERIQRALPNARVVKAFNTVGSPLMVKPQFEGGPPTMFIAGDDEAAKGAVAKILVDFGWEVADQGGIEAARTLEPLCLLWVTYGYQSRAWHHAFKMLR